MKGLIEKLGAGKFAAICAGTVAVVAAVVVIIVIAAGKKEESFRTIKVYEISGEAVINRKDIGEINAYENMVLESGDQVTMNSGTMTLKLDEDKYVYVEEGAAFDLVATGNSDDSRTTINLTTGAITNEIQNKLSTDSTYEVNTPNSTMSVRGTVFRVCVYEKDGVLYTDVSVFDGVVETNLIYKDGKRADSSKILSVEEGLRTIIFEDEMTTDYVGDGITEIDYDDIPDELIELLVEKGFVDAEELANRTGNAAEEPGPFMVTFVNDGETFAWNEVEKGETVPEPTLMPTAAGHWDFDFGTPITKNTTIEWIPE